MSMSAESIVFRGIVAGLALGACISQAAEAPAVFELANGLRVRLVPDHEAKEVIVILATRAGILNEPQGSPHLAHIVEHATVFDVASPPVAQVAQEWFSQGKV